MPRMMNSVVSTANAAIVRIRMLVPARASAAPDRDAGLACMSEYSRTGKWSRRLYWNKIIILGI
ncbi:hypothetical protein D3C80_1415790 [compost metagenome]